MGCPGKVSRGEVNGARQQARVLAQPEFGDAVGVLLIRIADLAHLDATSSAGQEEKVSKRENSEKVLPDVGTLMSIAGLSICS